MTYHWKSQIKDSVGQFPHIGLDMKEQELLMSSILLGRDKVLISWSSSRQHCFHYSPFRQQIENSVHIKDQTNDG